MYGEGTNPIPFIIAAYLIGAIGIFGFTAWVVWHRKRTTAYLQTLKTHGENS